MKRSERIAERLALLAVFDRGGISEAPACNSSRIFSTLAPDAPPADAGAPDAAGRRTGSEWLRGVGLSGSEEERRLLCPPPENERPSLTECPPSNSSRPNRTTRTSVTATIVEWRLRSPEPKMAEVPK